MKTGSFVRVAVVAFWIHALGSPPTALAFAGRAWASAEEKCVQVFYDKSADPNYTLGRQYSIMVQNLLGHFPEFRKVVAPIESYKKGQLDACQASIYIGSYFENAIPDAFMEDYTTTKKNVAWLGYSIWKLGPQRLRDALGFDFSRLTTLSWDRKDPQGRPTFFKSFLYKGERFSKYGELVPTDSSKFNASWEMVALTPSSNPGKVLSTAENNGTGEQLPYVIRQKNRFYVADVPLSFVHESDRYLIFADLLFDILDAKPRYPGKRPAVFRIEDISSEVSRADLLKIGKVLNDARAPFHIALIPIFTDPFNESELLPGGGQIPLTKDWEFLKALYKMQSYGAHFILHGITHQYKNVKNPFTGMSGDDFEFWDANKLKPIAEDSAKYVLNRLDWGWDYLEAAQIYPAIWEVPHYQASALDYRIFANVFAWNIGRMIYFDHEVKGLPSDIPTGIRYMSSGSLGAAWRRSVLGNVSVEYKSAPVGQFFPYEIYGDLYGQKVFPENLGNVQYTHEMGAVPRSPAEMIADAKRNLVIRDSWASFFFHTFIVGEGRRRSFPARSLDDASKLVNGLRALGYEFISLDAFPRNGAPIEMPQ